MVKGLSKDAAERLLEARARISPLPLRERGGGEGSQEQQPRSGLPRRVAPSPSPQPSPVKGEGDFETLALAAQLNRHDMNALAAAGALATITGHRREAAWVVTGIHPRPPVLDGAPISETMPHLNTPTEGDDLVADYTSLGLTLGRHPLALLRSRLARLRMLTAAEIRQMPHGKLARAAGLVIGRQRPETASGVIFVTLEDETGMVNVVVWRSVAENQRRALLASHLLAVHGVIERQGEVVHLIAGRLEDHSALLGRLVAQSRDFH